MWQRITHRETTPPESPPGADLRRDPDLDIIHHEQHALMSDSGYVGQRIRDSWNERVKRSWNPDGA